MSTFRDLTNEQRNKLIEVAERNTIRNEDGLTVETSSESNWYINEEKAQQIIGTPSVKLPMNDEKKREIQQAKEIIEKWMDSQTNDVAISSKQGVIQLDRGNPAHREWYEDTEDYDI